MNTAGHHRIAEEAGLPELVAALSDLGHERVPLNAFLLGNWITDVHQLVDPVAIRPSRFRSALREVMAGVRAAALIEVDTKEGKGLKSIVNEAVREALDDFEERVGKAIESFFAPTPTGSIQGFEAIRTMFRVTGYFKFAAPIEPKSIHPWEPASGYRMNVDAYFRVFAELFDQYWPHQHLDRPEILPSTDPPKFRSEVADGPRARSIKLTPDLYSYLREDIEIAAGALFEVDREWATSTFETEEPFDPDDEAWNVWLARFGQAMHAVEDFFAHTNFVEHAITLLGRDAIPKGAEEEVYVRRLLRLGAKTATGRPAPEPEVVSGYFDVTDTIFSLVHHLEEFFGLYYRDPRASAADKYDSFKRKYGTPNKAWFEAQKMVNDVSEWLADPDEAAKNPDNQLTKKLEKEKFRLHEPPTEEDVRRLLAEFPAFRDAPDQVKHDLITALVVVHGVTDAGITIYQAYTSLRDFVQFLDGPTDYITRWLSEKIDAAIRDAVIFYAREWLHNQLGGRRIGSHSLMNHDAREAVLFEEAMQLAMAVHWYVVSVMTRRLHGMDQAVQSGWSVDWYELLEYFLRHPKAVPGGRTETLVACASVEHVVDNRKRLDTLATLAKRYAVTSCHPATFTWRTIADALYDTKGLPDGKARNVVNRTIAAQGTGFKVKDGINYSWNPGLRILIPDQKFEVPMTVVEESDPLWWRAVLRAKDWKEVRGRVDPDSRMSTVGEGIEHRLQRLSVPEVDARISAAGRRLQARRAAYQVD